eukprot:g1971.t1
MPTTHALMLVLALVAAAGIAQVAVVAAAERQSSAPVENDAEQKAKSLRSIDPDGEAMWGHVRLRHDLSTGFEFFRALFGGVFPCDYRSVVVLPDDDLLCPSESDYGSTLEGKFVIVSRGECSFSDKAIKAQELGAAGLIVANSMPGMIRMPSGILKVKKKVEVKIPVVMITKTGAKTLKAVLAREPGSLVKMVGERRVKGKTIIVGRCAESTSSEVAADGSVKDLGSSFDEAEEFEGGILFTDDATGFSSREFLKAMFGGPLPREPKRIVVGEPRTGCADLSKTAGIDGAIVLLYRGECMFTTKSLNAEAAGAVGVLI